MRRVLRFLVLLGFIFVCLGAGWLGSQVTVPAIDGWYRELSKPSWTPPDWLFGPVWTALYVTMGIAAWLVWRTDDLRGESESPDASELSSRRRKDRLTALALFAVQLALNVGWSWVFFGLRSPGWAAIEIVALWLAIFATIVAFFRVSPGAAWLMLPYWAWVTFAACLNVAIWTMNRT